MGFPSVFRGPQWLSPTDMIRILNVSLVGTPGGPTVRVMCLADLFPYLTAVSLVHHIYIYIHLVSRTEEQEGSLYSLRCNPLIIVKIADWRPWFFPARVFHVKIVSHVRSCFCIIC
jgi:hypothetical protein